MTTTIGTSERYIFFLYPGSQSRLHLIRYPTTVQYFESMVRYQSLLNTTTTNNILVNSFESPSVLCDVRWHHHKQQATLKIIEYCNAPIVRTYQTCASVEILLEVVLSTSLVESRERERERAFPAWTLWGFVKNLACLRIILKEVTSCYFDNNIIKNVLLQIFHS